MGLESRNMVGQRGKKRKEKAKEREEETREKKDEDVINVTLYTFDCFFACTYLYLYFFFLLFKEIGIPFSPKIKTTRKWFLMISTKRIVYYSHDRN